MQYWKRGASLSCALSSSSTPRPLRQRLVATAIVAEMSGPISANGYIIYIYTVAAAAPTVAAKGEWATQGILTSHPLRQGDRVLGS